MARAKGNPLTDRELTAEQAKACAALAEGQDLGQAAELAGVPVDNVRAWLRSDAAFIAELNGRRRAGWDTGADRLRALVPKAIDALGGLLDAEDPKVQHAAAVSILRAVGLFGQDLAPKGATNAQKVAENMLWDL